MRLFELTPEQEALLLLSRISFNEEEKDHVVAIVSDSSFKWLDFIRYALYHKTLTLCWHNIRMLVASARMPRYLNDIVNLSYVGIKERNEICQCEIRTIVERLARDSIYVIPVKGAMLIPDLYRDYGIRYSGDIDFLIKFKDVKRIPLPLKELGFERGYFDASKGRIVSPSREDLIGWRLSLSNEFPFSKIIPNPVLPFIKLDFRFALDDSLNKNPIDEIIDAYVVTQKVSVSHILIHLCTHFYNEANHTLSIQNDKGFNLIKLCDIREYILKYVDDDAFNECINFAKHHNLIKQIYFSMQYLNLLYHDGYEEKVLSLLEEKGRVDIQELLDRIQSDQGRFQDMIQKNMFSFY